MSDVQDFNQSDDARKARVLWRMAGCPMGEEGFQTMLSAVTHSTPEQALETLRDLSAKAGEIPPGPCVECDGSGYLDDAGAEICTECEGTGEVED